MGARYNWKYFKYWVEFTPFVYVRTSKRHPDGHWKHIFEKWW